MISSAIIGAENQQIINGQEQLHAILNLVQRCDAYTLHQLLLNTSPDSLHAFLYRNDLVYILFCIIERHVDNRIECNMMNLVLILNNDVDINIKDSHGYTLLHKAVEFGYIELIIYLIEKGANVNSKINDGKSILHSICTITTVDEETEQNQHWIIKHLIENGANANSKTMNGESILHDVCKQGGSYKVIQLLIDKQIDLNITNNKGNTVLHHLSVYSKQKYTDLVKILLDAPDIDRHPINKKGHEPLYYARIFNNSNFYTLI